MIWARGLGRSFDLTGLLRRPALALGAGSLADFRSYWAAPATCPCFGRGVSGGGLPLLYCSGDLPSCFGREVCGVWPLLCAGPSPGHFCAGLGLCSGPALTTRGRHTRRLVCPAWARAVSETGCFCAGRMISVCLALTLRWAESSPLLRGVRLCSGPALVTPARGRHTQRLVCPTWARDRGGHVISVCLALTLR